MSTDHTGNVSPAIDAEEHDQKNFNVKKVGILAYGVDGDQYLRLAAVESSDSPGNYGLVIINHDGSSVS